MGIQDDIKQRSFSSSRQKAIVNILYTYGWTIEQIKNMLSKVDITHQQYNILRILRGAMPEPLSTAQIRDRMLDKMSDSSRIVDRLILKGLVKKCVCSRDKRLVDVTITRQGLDLLQAVDADQQQVDDIMSSLSEEEAETLSSLLDKMRNRD